MLVYRPDQKNDFDSSFATHAADAQMVDRMRMVLAGSVLLGAFIEPAGLSVTHPVVWPVFVGYFFYSVIIFIYSQLNHRLSQSKLSHRLDVVWFAMIVMLTGGIDSLFFLFFFFAILTSSIRWGLEEGAKVTIVCAVLFTSFGLVIEAKSDVPSLLLRTTFLLALGYMCVYWGESKVQLTRQLVLLRDVSRLSNPRFGVDQTITNVLEKTRDFYNASLCILVIKDSTSGTCSIRTVKEGDASPSVHADPVSAEAARPLMVFSNDQLVTYSRPRWKSIPILFAKSLVYDCARRQWFKLKDPSAESLAGLLEARSFISAPLRLTNQFGRLFVISINGVFDKADTLFLNHIAGQTFPVIENIQFLDGMASDAASQERQKIALDIHDRTIQPYIGLKLGLSALQNKASADNPLFDDIDRLLLMSEKVIDDLRHFAVTFRMGSEKNEAALRPALEDQAAQIKAVYGIDITLVTEGEIAVSERLTTEVLQFVREASSNISKHTDARRGYVTVACVSGVLMLQIENECTCLWPTEFIPRSICERAAALGGKVEITHGSGVNTAVRVEIPV